MGKKRQRRADPAPAKSLRKMEELNGDALMIIALTRKYAERHGREAALHILGTAAESLSVIENDGPDV